MNDAACLFCRIVERKLPADIVAEEEGLLAFKDVNPQAPIHLLIVPTEHVPSVADLTERQTPLIGRAIHFANRLAHRHQLTPAGYRLVINCGPQAGQSVSHLHLHLLGGRPLRWPPG
ncbi:MAG: histidine triad nucleotide-binding protein [Candidatus Omnitrophota bacterium]|nr:histidine triad nucleotide-binding protein [Candidatus Omnitrophota bacterium]